MAIDLEVLISSYQIKRSISFYTSIYNHFNLCNRMLTLFTSLKIEILFKDIDTKTIFCTFPKYTKPHINDATINSFIPDDL